jgi:hypothetical protein
MNVVVPELQNVGWWQRYEEDSRCTALGEHLSRVLASLPVKKDSNGTLEEDKARCAVNLSSPVRVSPSTSIH